MRGILIRLAAVTGLAFSWVNAGYALDSYRFLHVTIETPWTIFIFLLLCVFVPFVLMATLSWRFAERKAETEKKPPSAGATDPAEGEQ
jgi:hypothetical protein